jgi:hypothetical protein
MPARTAPGGVARPSRGELAHRRRELLREPERLVTRREAAQLLGVSLDTVDRRVRQRTGEARMSSGAIGLPAAALAEVLHDPWPGRGRAAQLDASVLSRLLAERRAGRSFGAIAAALNDDRVATVHGGDRWWPATVRKVVMGANARSRSGTARMVGGSYSQRRGGSALQSRRSEACARGAGEEDV